MEPRREIRISSVLTALVFLTMGGFAGVETHPGPHHGPHPGRLAATGADVVGPPAHGVDAPSARAEVAHTGHHTERHHESGECTCVGDCLGGGAPPSPEPGESILPGGDADRRTAVLAFAGTVADQEPIPYLLPFPNPPPSLL